VKWKAVMLMPPKRTVERLGEEVLGLPWEQYGTGPFQVTKRILSMDSENVTLNAR
jgi:hypothetical protein